MNELTAAPVLSTPETHIFEDPTPVTTTPRSKRLSGKELYDVYEVSRTAREVVNGGWRRIALQFPDAMLGDAPAVFEALETELASIPDAPLEPPQNGTIVEDVMERVQELDITKQEKSTKKGSGRRRLYILADTSYGACCVDEIAAEHVDADVVVHYGRSCLSPTARLPVIYVFTSHPLPLSPLVDAFRETYPERDTKVVLMADITYNDHIPSVIARLQEEGYTNVFAPEVIHDPSSLLPNRTVPPGVTDGKDELRTYSLFHISDPPRALLLTLSSRLSSMYIYPTTSTPNSTVSLSTAPSALQASTAQLLRRRYALLTSLSTCSIFGILINTLSVKNYLHVITTLQARIAAAGKKSYTFVVGKVNAAKVANFSEIGGWVVVGCWESSLVENTEFYRPVITPFELGLALMGDEERVWTGEWTGDWTGDFDEVMKQKTPDAAANEVLAQEEQGDGIDDVTAELEDGDDDEESAPPEFDLRTGRYISHSRPMRNTNAAAPKSTSVQTSDPDSKPSNALLKRATGELAMINGAASPGAEYLRTQRTWTGLGSDFVDADENGDPSEDDIKGGTVEEGRSGVARGYRVGDEDKRT